MTDDATKAARENQGPPAGVSPSELWVALTTLPLPHEVVDFPVKDPVLGQSVGQVAIVPLTPEELMISRKVADEWTRKLLKPTGDATAKVDDKSTAYQEIFGDEAAVQILWRALRDVNDKTLEKPAFPAPIVLRQKRPFSADLLAVLLKTYQRVCATKGPIVASMTENEMDAWLDALEEGGASFPFAVLSWELTIDLLRRSVERFKALRMASSSAGSPPGAPSFDPSSSNETPRTSADETPLSPSLDDYPIAKADRLDIPDP